MGNMNYNKHRVSINRRSLIDAAGCLLKVSRYTRTYSPETIDHYNYLGVNRKKYIDIALIQF